MLAAMRPMPTRESSQDRKAQRTRSYQWPIERPAEPSATMSSGPALVIHDQPRVDDAAAHTRHPDAVALDEGVQWSKSVTSPSARARRWSCCYRVSPAITSEYVCVFVRWLPASRSGQPPRLPRAFQPFLRASLLAPSIIPMNGQLWNDFSVIRDPHSSRACVVLADIVVVHAA